MNINLEKLKELTKTNFHTVRSLANKLWITENYLTNIRSWSKIPWPQLMWKIIKELKTTKNELIK